MGVRYLFRLPLLSTQESSQIATSAFCTFGNVTGTPFSTLSHARASLLCVLNGWIGYSAHRTTIASFVVFALAFHAVDALFTGQVADGLEESTLANLSADEIVHAILEMINLINACNFCFAECVWCMSVLVFYDSVDRGDRVSERTFGGVRSLVIVAEPLKILVLHPWHPSLVLLVVVLAGPLPVRLLLLSVGLLGERFGDCVGHCNCRFQICRCMKSAVLGIWW